MELLIGLLVIAGIGFVVYRNLDKKMEEKANSSPEAWPFPTSRPAEGDAKEAPYKVEPPAETTTKIDGIGHESIPVIPVLTQALDVNKDGKVDLADAKEAVKKVKEKAKSTAKKAKSKADVNKDGKVDLKDAKEAVKKVTKKTKK